MWVRTSRLAAVVACQLITLSPATAVADQSSGSEAPKQSSSLAISSPSEGSARRVPTDEAPASRVLISEPVTARAVRHASQEAWRQLREPNCQALLTEFTDRRGQPLTDNIPADAGDLRTYLARLVFVDGSGTQTCAEGALAVTEPGSRVVRVCSSRLVWTWQQNSTHVVAALIHEALHTLGLGENPPSSAGITSRVLKRCGRVRALDSARPH
jgi:hypothetical protein